MKRILILTAGFGEGHNAAARNIQDGLKILAPEQCEVQVIDLFERCYKWTNLFFQKLYIFIINQAPQIWAWLYELLNQYPKFFKKGFRFKKMERVLCQLLEDFHPHVVVVTYPVYNFLIERLYQSVPKPFHHITIVTDSISINALWYQALSDWFIVTNEQTAHVFYKAGIVSDRIKILGFPVPMAFALESNWKNSLPDPRIEKRVLYIINSGHKKATEIVKKLLEIKDLKITIATGRSKKLLHTMETISQTVTHRVQVLGWTKVMSKLLMTNHLVISKAGGATTQEAIAASCPMVVSQIIPGQEEGNFEVLSKAGAGLLASSPNQIFDFIQLIFSQNAEKWREMRNNISQISQPNATQKIINFILKLPHIKEGAKV